MTYVVGDPASLLFLVAILLGAYAFVVSRPNLYLAVYMIICLTYGFTTTFLVPEPILGGGKDVYLIAGLLIVVLRRGERPHVPALLVCSIVASLLISGMATLNGAGGFGIWLAGFRILALPMIALAYGYLSLEIGRWVKVVPLLAVCMCANGLLAAWQTTQSPAELISRGYTYGATIRNFGQTIRGFGLFTRDNVLGQTSGVFVALALWLELTNVASKPWRRLLFTGSALCLVASLNRTATISTVIGCVLILRPRFAGPKGSKLIAKLFRITVLAAVGGALLSTSFGSLFSVTARLHVWATLIHPGSLLLGRGPAAAGVAASTVLAGHGHVESAGDNYFLTILAQYGIMGFIIFAPFLSWVWKGTAKLRYDKRYPLLIGLLAYLGSSLITTNTWEEFPSAQIILLIVGTLLRPAVSLPDHPKSKAGARIRYGTGEENTSGRDPLLAPLPTGR
jgi:hypothetical protein